MTDTERRARHDVLDQPAALSPAHAVVEVLRRAMELRDPATALHQERVGAIAAAIGCQLDLPQSDIEGVAIAASLHDIGKLAIPAEILHRPGDLSRTEREVMRTHPQRGHDIVGGVDLPWPVAKVVLQHHERLDGTGYPGGLRGKDIALECRIAAVADVLEAVTAHRSYRPALDLEHGLAILQAGRGAAFDGDVVDAAHARSTIDVVLAKWDTEPMPERSCHVRQFGPLRIDTLRRAVQVAGESVTVTRREFDLLAALALEPGRVFTRDELLDRVWKSRAEWQSPATVTEHVYRLRVKLGVAAAAISTRNGVGYVFAMDPAVS